MASIISERINTKKSRLLRTPFELRKIAAQKGGHMNKNPCARKTAKASRKISRKLSVNMQPRKVRVSSKHK